MNAVSKIGIYLALFLSLEMTFSGEKKEAVFPWGQEKGGVRTRLVPLEDRYHVGKPMGFRLEMKNVSDRVVEYDSQAVSVHDPLAISKDGVEVSPAGGPVQTKGGARPLAPGKIAVLAERIDIGEEYLITEPGSYKIRFRGKGPAFGTVHFPESETIELEIGKGKLRPALEVAKKLSAALPDDRWELSLGKESVYFYCNRTGLKEDVFTMTVLVKRKRLSREKAKDFELLGTGKDLFLYINETPGMTEIGQEWKNHRDVILEATGIKEP